MPPLEFFSRRFHYTFGPHAPMLRIAAGTALRVTCPDSDNELSDGTLLSPDQRQADVAGLFEGNPMAGPIYVEGAAAGDCLAVRIDEIELDRATGQTGLAPSHGLLPAELLLKNTPTATSVPRHLYRWRIDAASGTATVANPLGPHPITVPLNPFVGCIGVCPPWGQAISTLLCGAFGGNMDIPACRAGATIYLPVFVDGALLMMGDIHAAQGHGEIIGGGIETSGKIQCTITAIKGGTIPAPRLRDDSHLTAIGVAGELRAAVQEAYAHLLDWLTEGFGLNRWDGYHLISQTGSLMIGGLGMPPHAVAARIPLAVLPPAIRALSGWRASEPSR